MRKNYSQEQKSGIVNSYLSGKTISELNSEFGVSRSTIYKWIDESSKCQKPDRKVNMRDYFDLKQQCEQQKVMIEILQNAPCTIAAPLAERYEYILNLSEKYSVNLLCKTMKVAKGSYYNHILRNKKENTKFEEKKRELKPIIEKIFDDSKQIYGASKIHAILKDRGYIVGQNTVADIMHENGWFCIGHGAKKLYYMNLERKEDLLKQQFTVTRPNEVWVSDITYFKYNNTVFYICVILDLFARKVISHRISLNNSTQLTKNTFMTAYNERQPQDLIFHSDQGCNYTSGTFRMCLKDLNVKQSFSNPGNPFNNSVMESFFKSMKTERLYRTDFHSEREFRIAVKEYVEFYNKKRPHSVLRYRTPNKCEEEYIRKQAALRKFLCKRESKQIRK